MINIIISDTHAPSCLIKAREYSKEILSKIPEVDAIVVNGDVLGLFAMDESCIYKGREMKIEEKLSHLKLAAPNFLKEWNTNKKITKDLVYSFVRERYSWIINELIKFSQLNFTIFNMGNHESKLHFLVLNEIPFLTGDGQNVINNLDQNKLISIFENFERNLYDLEKSHNFRYMKDTPIILKDTLIFGIPGESHSTVGNNFASIAQENKTKELIILANKMIPNVKNVIIYNHTQGDYDRSTGKHDTASVSLKNFMNSLPEHIKAKVFVQSHNHWNQTQFMYHSNWHYIMNNAGLHDGLFNMIDFTAQRVNCYDLDPVQKKTIKLKLNTNFNSLKSKKELLARNYPDPEYIEVRKSLHQTLNMLNLN
jgi:hypothetical protein